MITIVDQFIPELEQDRRMLPTQSFPTDFMKYTAIMMNVTWDTLPSS
jgi:hypothetical protein